MQQKALSTRVLGSSLTNQSVPTWTIAWNSCFLERALLSYRPLDTEPTSWGLNAKRQASCTNTLPGLSVHGDLRGNSRLVQWKQQGPISDGTQGCQVLFAQRPNGVFRRREAVPVCVQAYPHVSCPILKVPCPPREQETCAGDPHPSISQCSAPREKGRQPCTWTSRYTDLDLRARNEPETELPFSTPSLSEEIGH